MTAVNKEIKQEIEHAGCPFENLNQLLIKEVCLMPDYVLMDPPQNPYGLTNVDVDLHLAQILEIDETKNKITIQLEQNMEWDDSRIKANFSAMQNIIDDSSYTPLSVRAVEKIWHPYLDIFTQDLQDWKSLYDPLWFQHAGITKCPWYRDCKLAPNTTTMYAATKSRVTVFCKFDFSSYPFDKQKCKFRRGFVATSDMVKFFLYDPSAAFYTQNKTKKRMDWRYQESGFEVTIKPFGNIIDTSTMRQNYTTNEYGFDITLERIVEPYLFQYYFPCAAIVIVSQVSFIIPLKAIPGRVALMVTQFLTLTNIFIHQMVSKYIFLFTLLAQFLS